MIQICWRNKILLVESEENMQSDTFEVDITYCVIYQASNGINAEKEEKMAFGLTNAIFNSWPYAREHIQNISMKMGLKPFIMPLVKIVDLPKIFKNPENDK
jgi:preprotein translocase subunit SecB